MVRKLRRRSLAALLAVVVSVLSAVTAGATFSPVAHAATALSTTANITFGPSGDKLASGYTLNTGKAFDGSQGWTAETSMTPVDATARTRERKLVSDPRLDSLIHMQSAPTGATVGLPQIRFQYALPSGSYVVGVTVGDPDATNSTHRLVVEGTVAVNAFVPTAAKLSYTATVTVNVTDGFLTLDSSTGQNTKLQDVTIAPANSTSTPPATATVTPPNGQTGVGVDVSIVVVLGRTVSRSLDLQSAFTLTTGSSTAVPFTASTDAADQTIHINPNAWLKTSTVYTVASTAALKTADGVPVTPFTVHFTTASTSPAPTSFKFTRQVVDTTASGWTVGALGPDGNVYEATASGLIRVYKVSGTTVTKLTDINSFTNQRTILGLAFDPLSTANNLILWVANNYPGNQNVPNFTGKLSKLTGADYAHLTERDVLTGLPRSIKDHETNGLAFGPPTSSLYSSSPTRKLLIAQGANTSYGGPSDAWGNYQESPLSASVLVADVDANPAFKNTIDVSDAGGTENYDPKPATAPVRVYGYGMRNPFSIVLHSNGRLYAPVNESTGGYTPANCNKNGMPSYYIDPSYDDYLAYIQQGAYYGHPNPSQGFCILNGGNPTAGTDPDEVAYQGNGYLAYPVGTKPDTGFDPSLRYDLGLHRSPDGMAEYINSASSLNHQLLVSDFATNDIRALRLDSSGRVAGQQTIISGSSNLYSPLGIVQVGNSFLVDNFGDGNNATGGYLELITPLN